MNSKERVKAAIDKKPVDHPPLGLYATDHDTISKVIGRPTLLRNRVEWTLALWGGRRDEAVESMKQDIVDYYTKLDCVDLITAKEAFRVPPKGFYIENPPKKIDEKTYRDDRLKGFWKLEPCANDVMFFPDDSEHEFTVDEFASREFLPGPVMKDFVPHGGHVCRYIPDPSEYELMDYLAEKIGNDRYLMIVNEHVSLTLLGGIENGLITLALQPDVVKAANEQDVFRQNVLDQYMIRPWADGILTERDMAGTNGPMISPAMFRELCFPYFKERLAHMRKYCRQIIFHNCGNNIPLLDQFIDAGIDGYQSIQTTSAMSISALKEASNGKLAIWGAVPLEMLIEGTPADVRKAVRKCFEEADGFPGFILGPSHSIAFGTKYDNFMAMLDEFNRLSDA